MELARLLPNSFDKPTVERLHPLVRRAVYFAMRDKNPGAFALTD
jgi:hypothetical protein